MSESRFDRAIHHGWDRRCLWGEGGQQREIGRSEIVYWARTGAWGLGVLLHKYTCACVAPQIFD